MKMRKLDPNIIRVGDTVKIVNPTFVIRCGYPLGIEDMEKEVEEHFGEAIIDILNCIGGDGLKLRDKNSQLEQMMNAYGGSNKNSKSYREIVRTLAYVRLKDKAYGGNERTLHTKVREAFRGQEGPVAAIRIVKTGTYSPSSGGYDRSGEYDYQPAYLTDVKTHKILTLGFVRDIERKINWGDSSLDDLKIEVTNVEKIQSAMETPIEYEYRVKQLEKNV